MTHKNNVIITHAAAAEIDRQFCYIRDVKQQPMNAARWLADLYAAVVALEDFAGYARAPESDFVGIELRQKVFKSHRIIFSLDENKHEVVILYVRHGARRSDGDE